ncbi:thiamine pyrophosphate-dependent enzyme, partial [Bacteroidota bacterium]
QYPLPKKMIEKMKAECGKIIVVEEGYPVVEEALKGFFDGCYEINGRLDGTLPRDGELNPTLVAKGLGLETSEGFPIPEMLANRPPMLCTGCSHRDIYNALNVAMKDIGEKRVFSDIGCYTLGALPPFNSINSCVDMGASITMAKGAADAGLVPSVAVIGDSTFTHSGITGLLDAVNENSPITVIISDNSTTAMTGGQDSTGTGKLDKICEGVGVEPEHIRMLNPVPKMHDEMVTVLKEELAYNGVSVVIAERECIQTLGKKKKQKAE